jgi:HD-GYP domain-containing protein (c-di-GMP phosphodiesterase class II)
MNTKQKEQKLEQTYYIEQLNEIGYLLSVEKDFHVVMKKILTTAKKLSNADAGTFYLMSDDGKFLEFSAVQTDSLKLNLSKAQGNLPWPDLPLYKENGDENDINISAYSALKDKLVNVKDVYDSTEFDFEGPRAFDKASGYRTKSMLVVPMKNYDNDVIGVLQLINKKDTDDKTIPFSSSDEKLILSLSSQAAMSITQQRLVDDLENLLDSFIQAIATAIGEKSKYTQGHINRVSEIALDIAHAINEDTTGVFKDKYFDQSQLKEIDVAAWMHDVGKITTPDHVVDKATKLETIYDRINMIKVKFELLKQQKYIALLENKLSNLEYEEQIKTLDEQFLFLEQMNFGGEFMCEEKIEKVHQIAKHQITIDGEKQNLLTDDEIKNLCIVKGTLTDQERFIINNHAKLSFDILSSLPFPKKLKNVPTIAGGHHEKICGGGYPFGLQGEEISFEARILAIADIFEALTASDRPYKKPNTLNQSIKILSFMVKDGELDKDLVKFFLEKKLHLKYAATNLEKSQIDEVDVVIE